MYTSVIYSFVREIIGYLGLQEGEPLILSIDRKINKTRFEFGAGKT